MTLCETVAVLLIHSYCPKNTISANGHPVILQQLVTAFSELLLYKYIPMLKTIVLLLVLLLTGFTPFYAQQPNKIALQPLADSLATMVSIDQIAANIPTGKYKSLPKEVWLQFKDSVFVTHQQILEKIFLRVGYPGYDLVGEKGSHHFWLMVQHCDKTPAFQEKVLAAMKIQVAKRNADPKDYAYLIDRVMLNTNRKQVYGTQVTYNLNTCQSLPRPLRDSMTVNERRAKMGLGILEEYLNSMSSMHFEMNKDMYVQKGITQANMYVVPALPASFNKQLALLIDSLSEEDQKPVTMDTAQNAEKAFKEVTKRNIPVLKKIVHQYGFAGYNLVGKESSDNFWMLVQHSDADVAFQKEVLPLMDKQVQQKNASGDKYAYLVDRININEGRKQVYGTQVSWATGSPVPKPLENPDSVDDRRKAVGMQPLAVYLENMIAAVKEINKNRNQPDH